MHVVFVTLYPEMFPGILGHSLTGTALKSGTWSYDVVSMRDYAVGKHAHVDDTPYGGGAGMVLRADVVAAAIDAARTLVPDAQLVYMTPRGVPLTQEIVCNLASNVRDMIVLCGRFEAIDERVIAHYKPQEISIGDYILLGGEVAAMVVMEACLRHVPGVLGNPDTHAEESFTIGKESAGLLEYPHYTKPPFWEGKAVPDVLRSGHHGAIATWRREQAEAVTRERRPDLWTKYTT